MTLECLYFLTQARADFDSEKAEALLQATLEHERVQKEKEEALKKQHETECEVLNTEWTEKMRLLSEQALIRQQVSILFLGP